MHGYERIATLDQYIALSNQIKSNLASGDCVISGVCFYIGIIQDMAAVTMGTRVGTRARSIELCCFQ